MHLQAASQQDAVSQKLHMLETHQRETHDSLVQMERTAISMYQVTWLVMHVLLVQAQCAKLQCPVCPAIPRAVIKRMHDYWRYSFEIGSGGPLQTGASSHLRCACSGLW